MYLNSFDAVKEQYRSTKPVVSKYHTKEDDIRPIGDRKRKWERIIKVNDNCYALTHDGMEWDYKVDGAYTIGIDNDKALNEAPIVWSRVGGKEYVSVQSMSQYGSVHAITKFLRQYLPLGLTHSNVGGKTYIHARHRHRAETKYYLPRTVVGENQRDILKFERFDVTSTYSATWELVSEEYVEPVTVVAKDAKKEFKPYNKAFYEWMMAIAPLLPLNEHEYLSNMASNLRHSLDLHTSGMSLLYTPLHNSASAETVREVFINPDHPARLQLAVLILTKIRYLDGDEELSLRKRYNYWINNNCGFLDTRRTTRLRTIKNKES